MIIFFKDRNKFFFNIIINLHCMIFNICRISALCIGASRVRILLFRECEWRGRKLLFDSLSLEKKWCKNKTAMFKLKNNINSNDDSINFGNNRIFEVMKNY